MPRKVLNTVVQDPRENGSIQVEVTLPVSQRRRELRAQPGSASNRGSRPCIPRITRLMALAIKFQQMVDRGEVRDYADLARLGYVTRARITQIMNLLLLAPDIQEQILLAETTLTWCTEHTLRHTATAVTWEQQRSVFRSVPGCNMHDHFDARQIAIKTEISSLRRRTG